MLQDAGPCQSRDQFIQLPTGGQRQASQPSSTWLPPLLPAPHQPSSSTLPPLAAEVATPIASATLSRGKRWPARADRGSRWGGGVAGEATRQAGWHAGMLPFLPDYWRNASAEWRASETCAGGGLCAWHAAAANAAPAAAAAGASAHANSTRACIGGDDLVCQQLHHSVEHLGLLVGRQAAARRGKAPTGRTAENNHQQVIR